MFATIREVDRLPTVIPVTPAERAAAVAAVAVGTRPLVPAADRVIEVPGALADLLPDRGLRRGSTVTVGTWSATPTRVAGGQMPGRTASGATALALALLGPASGTGVWCAAVALPELGLAAAGQAGIHLDRLALVPRPGTQWAVVTAALLDGVELLLARPPGRLRPADARRLVARTRERDAVLVVLGHDRWPEPADVRLTVVSSAWSGLGGGHGHLRTREVEVAVTGRRAAARERRGRLLLPGPDAAVAVAPAIPVVTTPVAGTAVAGKVAVGSVAVGTAAIAVGVAEAG
jgi:hypothetical protein